MDRAKIEPIESNFMERYYKIVVKERKETEVLNRLCRDEFGLSFKEVVLMDPLQMESFVSEIIDRNTEGYRNKFGDIFGLGNYIDGFLYDNFSPLARRMIFDNAGQGVCPYCDRNYISMVVDKGLSSPKYLSFFELDHRYSKTEYPMLAVSFYNLIPVCPTCNRIKGRKKLRMHLDGFIRRNVYDSTAEAQYIYRYDYDFSFEILGSSFLTNKDEISVNIDGSDANGSVQHGLYLRELYDNHKDIIQEIILKARCYGLGYFQNLVGTFDKMSFSEIDTYRFFFGNYLETKDWGKRPLAKFTYDIAKETLGYYGIDVDKIG